MLSRPTLIYNGACGFCRSWIDRIRRWDRGDRLDFLPLQAEDAPVIAGRPRRQLEAAAHLILPSGEVFSGAQAAREACRFLPGGWIPRAVLSVPGALPLAERAYQWIARTWGPVGARPGGR